ncbi:MULTISPECIES: flavodoxin family protein [unclassified Desulfovibrio]|uniref:flavodoxin family protein n=1 Tax=unclassified Desulfovibrio TaxID=2593640 RepID=UPI0013E9F03D|nr:MULTISPECIES: flavodoxin family protein [unclassified Desulfovibrio]
MKILVLTGSPRKKSNSNILADEFIRGASENGHDIFRFDAARSDVHPCVGCNSCKKDGPCIFKDDFQKIREHILPARMVVFVSPLYWFGFCTQLKTVIDRFYALDKKLHAPKEAILLSTHLNTAEEPNIPLAMTYQAMLAYLGWSNRGIIQAGGLEEAGSITATGFPREAYELGKSIA